MKKRVIILLFFISLAGVLTVGAQTGPLNDRKPKVEVYYFHPTERCPIDQSIEENSRSVMKLNFAKEVKEGILKFRVLNTDDKANAKVVSRFDINAQALYIVKIENGKEINTDLTEFAFAYGQSNPSKFKLRLQEEIRKALK